MSEYKTIFGKAIKSLSSDPTDTGAEGQIWYNTTTGSFRTVTASAAWSAGGNLSTANNGGGHGAIGTQTSSIALTGVPGNSNPLATEEYNGSSWTAGASMASYSTPTGGNAIPQGGMNGSTTSALYSGGEQYTGNTLNRAQEYNGSTWTTISNPPITSGYNVGIGPSGTDNLHIGGFDAAYAFLSSTNGWNGSAWTAGGSLNTASWASMGGGSTNAGWYAGGNTGSYAGTTSNKTEEYNGSTWTTVNSMSNNRKSATGAGPQTQAFVACGQDGTPTRFNTTENYDGTTWTAGATAAVGIVSNRGAGGNSTSGLKAGGSQPPNTNSTEELSLTIYSPIAATWASGGNINTAREAMAGAGTQTAALISGGNIYPNSIQNLSEEYNGTSWTEGNNLTTSRRKLVGAGTQTAAVVFGGTTTAPVAPGATGKTEEYDGTSYTEQNDMSTARLSLMGAGLQDAAWAAGGYLATSTYSSATELYDGTTWTTSPATLNTARGDGGSAGTQTAAIIFGGISPLTANSEEFNGTTWSEGNNIPAATRLMASFGTQTYAVGAGGGDSPDNRTTAFVYDGTSWTNTASLSTGREAMAGSGYGTQPGSTGLAVGGSQNGNPMNAQTEEFTGEIVQLGYKTISDS
jgi:hypothetical protein